MLKEKEQELIGADTGFFYRLKEGDKTALYAFQECDVVVSILTLFELRRQSLKTNILEWEDTIALLEKSTIVMDVTRETAKRAANIAHGTGIPAIDSLILSTFLIAGCPRIFTTDAHFELYQRKGIEIINLRKTKKTNRN